MKLPSPYVLHSGTPLEYWSSLVPSKHHITVVGPKRTWYYLKLSYLSHTTKFAYHPKDNLNEALAIIHLFIGLLQQLTAASVSFTLAKQEPVIMFGKNQGSLVLVFNSYYNTFSLVKRPAAFSAIHKEAELDSFDLFKGKSFNLQAFRKLLLRLSGAKEITHGYMKTVAEDWNKKHGHVLPMTPPTKLSSKAVLTTPIGEIHLYDTPKYVLRCPVGKENLIILLINNISKFL